jgi:hypothetical protein
LQRGKRAWFILAHHTAITGDIGRQDCNKATLKVFFRHVTRSLEKHSARDSIGAPFRCPSGRTSGLGQPTIAKLEQSVVEDVKRIRSHPLVPRRIPI